MRTSSAAMLVLLLITSGCSRSGESDELAQVRAELDALKDRVATTTAAVTITATPRSSTITVPAATTTRAPATTRATTTIRVTTTTSPSCSLEDEGRDLIREWNRVSAELLASFMNTSVTAEQYVKDSERLLPILSRVVGDLRTMRSCLPADERTVFEPLLGTYNDKMSGYSGLETGVRLGSPTAQEDAIRILTDANARSLAMACEIARVAGQRFPGAELC